MAGTDRIDVVPLHREDILLQRFRIRHASGMGVELMTVDALEDDPFAV